MAFTAQQTTDVEAAMADFLARRRPPEAIRDKLDLSWRIEEPVAKATYVRIANRWRIYWQRADLKWHGYTPHPEAVFFEEFLGVVEEDECCCFWG